MSKIELKYEATRKIEKVQRNIAWMLPRWLVKWATVRLVLHATNGKFSDQIVPELSAMDALFRWEDGK